VVPGDWIVLGAPVYDRRRRQQRDVPYAGGPGGRDETLDAERPGIQEDLLGSVQRGGQGLGALQVGRHHLHVRREPRRTGIPAGRPDPLTRCSQEGGDLTAHVSLGAEDDRDHRETFLRIPVVALRGGFIS
jgi:hypothetical protein